MRKNYLSNYQLMNGKKIFNEAQKLSRKLNLRVKREFIKEKEHHQNKQFNKTLAKSRER